MPVGFSLETGILLKKYLHFLWDKYHFSIDPETWILHLSEEARKYNTEYLKYHNSKLSNNKIDLLKFANVELLIQHSNNFKKIENNRKNGRKVMEDIFIYKDNSIDDNIEEIYKAQDISEKDICQK
jgi:hypothetical protein